MQEPKKPDNEAQRLSALHGLNILGTPPEERFDRLTRLAARLFQVPIALVSLVDAERQLADLAGMVDRELALAASTTIDELTRLSNRRGFTMLSETVLALCHRQAQTAALVCIGLCGFQKINTLYGHAAADELLRQFARALLAHFRTSDVVARVGSNEFCVLGSGATEAQMDASLDRFEMTVSRSSIRDTYPAFSWSVGIVGFDPAFALDIEAPMQAAEAKMRAVRKLQLDSANAL